MTELAPVTGSDPLPAAISVMLGRFMRRARRLIVIRGVCATCTAALGAFLTVMLLDATLTLASSIVRWLLAILAYASVIGAALWFLIRPLARSFTLAGVARLVEQNHPELHERISSAVELLTSQDRPALRGSEALIQELAREAVRDVGGIHPKEELSWRLATPFVVSAAILASAMGALLLVKPSETAFLLARATAPFLNLSNVQARSLTVHPGDTLIAAGSPLTIAVHAAATGLPVPRLRMVDESGRQTALHMLPTAASNATESAFSVTLPSVTQSFRYRIQAGGALTRFFAARVSLPPVIEQLDVQCAPPAYAHLPPWQERDGAGTIRTLAGSAVRVTAKVNKPVSTAELLIRSGGRTNAFSGSARTTADGAFYDFLFTMMPAVDGLWTLQLTDEIGLQNRPFENTIQSLPDQPPRVQLTNMRQSEFRLNRSDRLPVSYDAVDDLGLALVDVLMTIADGTIATSQILADPTNATPPLRTIQGHFEIDLADARFAQAPRLTFHLRATDSLPPDRDGPQTGQTEPITIILEATAPSWQQQVLTSHEQLIRSGIAEAKRKLEEAGAKANALAAPLANETTLTDRTLVEAAALEDSLAAADSTMRRTADEAAQGFFHEIATNLTALAEQHINPAERLAGQLRLVDQPSERTAINSNVAAEVASALYTLDQLSRQFEAAHVALAHAIALDDMARQQAELAQARRAQEEAATSSTNVAAAATQTADWQQDQTRLAAEVAQLTQKTPGTAVEVASLISNAAAQAAIAAADLAVRQATNAAWMIAAANPMEQHAAARAELATRQQELATEAEQQAHAAAEGATMKQAAKHLRADAMTAALRDQAKAEQALRAESASRQQAAERTAANVQPAASSPAERAADAVRRSDAAVQAAGESARQADKDAARAADQSRDSEPARQERAASAEAWAKAANEAATQAVKSSQDARQAATDASNNDQAEAARQSAADRASEAAEQAIQHARQAQAFQQNAAREASQPDSPQDRAVQAADKATAAAAHAQLSATTASEAAANAQRNADAETAKSEPGAAEDARQRAVEASQASERAHQQAQQAVAAEQEARTAAELASKSDSPKAADAEADRAVAAAARAAEAARNAQTAAQQAMQAAAHDSPHTPSPVPLPSATAQQAADAASRANEQAQSDAQQAAQSAQRNPSQANAAALAQQAAERTARLAQAARQSAQDAQHAAQQSAAATTPQAKQEADLRLSQASQLAAAQAQAAMLAAQHAEQASTTAQLAADAAALANLAERQADLRRQTEALHQTEDAQKQQLLQGLASQVGDLQQQLASEAQALAREVDDASPFDTPAAQAATQAQQAAEQWNRSAAPAARQAAMQARDEFGRLADALEDAAWTADTPTTPEQHAHHAQRAQRAAAMQARQSALASQMDAIDAGRLMEALAAQQSLLNADAMALSKKTAVLRDQAMAFRSELPTALQPTGGAAEQANRAAQSAKLAGEAADLAAQQAMQPPTDGAILPAAQAAATAKTAAQHQTAAAQATQQAAESLASVANSMPAPPPPADAPSSDIQALAAAHAAALQAANNPTAMAAAQASAQLAQAARQAAGAATARGGNPSPPNPNMAGTPGQGSLPLTQSDILNLDGVADGFDPRLRNWLRLHGEREQDVLQAQKNEGPEEYRTIIKRYFREVSRRGDEEGAP